MEQIEIEQHPLPPFLPQEAKILMLGSFPPPKNRWSMDFFYPNLNNDMWRILGLIFYKDKQFFSSKDLRSFQKEKIERFLIEKHIALYDTATAVRRLKNNASDQYLEVVEPTNIKSLLNKIPYCTTLVTTGKKATEILQDQFSVTASKIGESSEFKYDERKLKLYRMPSSSRAYPLAIEKKAAVYYKMFQEIELI